MDRRWVSSWVAAQLTGLLVSSFVWLVVGAVWPLVPLAAAVVGIVFVTGLSSGPVLRWRFGARQATSLERHAVLAAIVPIGQLRGRGQPTIWVSARPGMPVGMPTPTDVVLGAPLTARVVAGKVPDADVSALVSHALGQEPVVSSRLVAVVDVYCLLWRLVEQVGMVLIPAARRVPLGSFAWRARWIVFGLAMVDSARSGRWHAFVVVALIAILSWSTGFLRRRWAATLTRLGDVQVRNDQLGCTLAVMIRRQSTALPDLERAERLCAGV